MIPVLGVPVLTGYELLARMLDSIDVEVERLVVVDNGGGCPEIRGAEVVRLPGNLGVAGSWNLVLQTTPRAPWWALVNHDLVFAPGDLALLTETMEAGAWCATLDGFAAFGISEECVEAVGYFDQNFVPAYCEDADMEYRIRLAAGGIVGLPSGIRHERSSTIAEPALGAENARTYPENRRYYAAKWGGDLRGGERFTSPFDSGADPSEWTLDPRRWRELAWETTALAPVGYERR